MKKFILYVVIGLSLMACQEKKEKCIFCPLKVGSVIATVKNNQIKWEMDEKIKKGNALQLAIQVQKALPQFSLSDTLIYSKSEIVNENDNYYWVSYFSLGKEKSFTLSVDLEKKNDQLLIASKPIEGCIGNHCSSCKLTKGEGCSCSGSGNCDHIVVELPLLFPF